MTQARTRPQQIIDATPARPDRFGWSGATAFWSGSHLRNPAPLAQAYGQWAATLRNARPVLIALADPLHALAAFYGILAQGRHCGIAGPTLAKSFERENVHLLDQILPPASQTKSIPLGITPFVTFTGGSTGTPKAILRQQSTWLHSFAYQKVGPYDRVAVLGDLSHSLASYAAVEALTNGADLYLLSDKRPPAQAQDLLGNSVTVLYATPTQIKRLRGAAPCPDMKHVYIGGGAFDEMTQSCVADLFPKAEVRTFYGSSETSFLTLADQDTPPGSVGKAYPGVKLKTSQGGSIWAQSLMMFDRYLIGGSAHTRTRNGFVSVGDLGQMDANGNLYLTGRADRAVSISDQTVQLDAIEQQVLSLGSVHNCAALAGKDTKRGHHLLLAVQGEISGIATLALPKTGKILKLNDWPTLPSGKTDYAAIARQFERAKS